ncbi:hypothetical protein CDAR_90921 [Caerostris darwini]|uniref:Uncharacterized protein n=1 Tax=Caerostris darwini TaxID=1538125 RepID=A0AAV4QE22_9ARAC|nr:hypothetical protein CDAR_90921 [Caerostris darwini]
MQFHSCRSHATLTFFTTKGSARSVAYVSLLSIWYLGIEVDGKLPWLIILKAQSPNIQETESVEKTHRNNLGATEDVLVTTYKSYVRPVLEYNSEAYNTAGDNTKNKLNIVQNNAVRLISGAAKSTPITAL